MKPLVVYYSFTGNTRKVATLLAKQLGCPLGEITCKAYTYGFLGGLRQAFEVFTGGTPPIETPAELNGDYDVLIAAGPVWGARPGPPIRSFVKNWKPNGKKLVLFLTCDGTSEKFPGEKALDEIVEYAQVPPIAKRLFKRADVEADDLEQRVAAFAATISEAVKN
jgi:flavodoxin